MKCKFSLLLFLCVLSLWGQAQSLNLQELVNKKQFQEGRCRYARGRIRALV